MSIQWISTGMSPSRSSSTSRSESSEPWRHVDWALMLFTAIIAVGGVLAVWSERTAKIGQLGVDPIGTVNRQGIGIAIGTLAMLTVMSVDYRKLRPFAMVFYLGSAGLLVLVRFIGQEQGGARAWINLGSFQLQPSELAKTTLVFMLATYCASERGDKLPYDRFVKALMILSVPLLLVLAQPDLGTASTLVAITMGVLLVAKATFKHIVLITLLTLFSGFAVYNSGFVKPYQLDRITSFATGYKERLIDQKQADGTIKKVSNKDQIQQVKYSKEAITLGRWTGAGFGEGLRTSSGDIPEQRTDFIFSAIGEQFGLLGTGALLTLYLILLLRMIRIAQIAPDHIGSLIAAGAATLLVWHVFENAGMNMGITPVTGIPLPLVSFGGSSAIAFLTMIGLVQNVHMRRYTQV